MFKKILSVLIASALSLSFVLSLASCTKKVEPVTESESEIADASDENGSKENERDSAPMSIFEYIDSVKGENVFVFLGLDPDTLKQYVDFFAAIEIDVENAINYAVPLLGIEGVSDLKDLCDFIDEAYPYEDAVGFVTGKVEQAKDKYLEVEDYLDDYESYSALLNGLIESEDAQQIINGCADILVVVLDKCLPSEAYEQLSGDDHQFEDAQDIVDFVVEFINDELADEIGAKLEEQLAYEELLANLEDGEDVFDKITGIFDEKDSYYELIAAYVPLDKVIFTKDDAAQVKSIISLFEAMSLEDLYNMVQLFVNNAQLPFIA